MTKIYNLTLINPSPITYDVIVGEKSVGTAELDPATGNWITAVGTFDMIHEACRALMNKAEENE